MHISKYLNLEPNLWKYTGVASETLRDTQHGLFHGHGSFIVLLGNSERTLMNLEEGLSCLFFFLNSSSQASRYFWFLNLLIDVNLCDILLGVTYLVSQMVSWEIWISAAVL